MLQESLGVEFYSIKRPVYLDWCSQAIRHQNRAKQAKPSKEVLRVHRNNCNCQTVVRRVHRKKFLLRLFRSFLGCSAPAFSPILGGEER